MSEFIAGAKAALPGALVSLLVSGLLLYYIRSYIDHKLVEEEKQRAEEMATRIQRSQLEMRRRRALGRLMFWMHRAIVQPPANGELAEAMEAFQEVEEDQKALDQKILAKFENGGGE